MRILLDECVDRGLRHSLPGHEVLTVPSRGWAGIKNGQLLALAEREFDVLITVDRRIPTEQKLEKFQIAVVLLRARSNRLAELKVLVPELLQVLESATAGNLTVLGDWR